MEFKDTQSDENELIEGEAAQREEVTGGEEEGAASFDPAPAGESGEIPGETDPPIIVSG